ncbi:MAG TPA: PHP domain-containing protein, partial [Myxococcaceae bacterium]|nr:PHP domain-containing protein [Myxococcaceae bacterium]
MLVDLHVHSHLSKGCDLDPRAVLDRAQSHGLDGVAFTETNTQDGCDELFDLGKRSKVKVFVGLELVTDKGEYLCFFSRPELAPEPVQMWGSNREKPWSAVEALPKLKALGAVVVASKPYDREMPHPSGDFILGLQGLSGVEGYNPKLRPALNDLALEAAETLRVPLVGGSDARATLDEVGRAATLFPQPINTQAELVEALKGGRFWPVMVGEIPRLVRPGEAREAERRGGNRKRKRPMRGGGRPG